MDQNVREVLIVGQNLLIFTISILSFFSSWNLAVAEAALQGSVKIDGSSTVFPISEAVVEEFGKSHPRVRATIGVSGTGGGFKKFCTGEIDINDASRAIKGSETELAKKNGIRFVELPIAYDGISILVHKDNTWVDHLTTEELKKIWQPGSLVKTWKDVRPSWPERAIRLYGPGTDSGTFDYFTEEINGKAQASRSDFTKSEDDNILIRGISGDRDSLGYIGFAYYDANRTKVKAVPIRSSKGSAVVPTFDTIRNGTYAPLSRMIYIYANIDALVKKTEVLEFVRFYLKNAAKLSKEVGYVPLPESRYVEDLARIEQLMASKGDSSSKSN